MVLAEAFTPGVVRMAAAVLAAATAAGTAGDWSCRCDGVGVVETELVVWRMCLNGWTTPFIRIQFTEILNFKEK